MGCWEALAALLHRNPYLFSVLLGATEIFEGKNEKPDTKVYGNVKYFTMAAQSICLEHHVYGLEKSPFFSKKKKIILKFLSLLWGNFRVFWGFPF